jgi:hypothetical protein
MNIINIINEAFGGDINDKRPLHINSMCRIAYCGYLKYYLNYSYKDVALVTNSGVGTTQDRIRKHRDFYSVDLGYKAIFDNIIKDIEDDNKH